MQGALQKKFACHPKKGYFYLRMTSMRRRIFLKGLAAGAAGALAAGRGESMLSHGSNDLQRSSQARNLHVKALIIDGHNDSLIEHRARKESMDLTRDWPSYQVDLHRMKAGGLTAVNSMVGDIDLVQGLELWSGMYENLEKHPGDFLLVKAPGDILRAKAEGKVGLIGQLESCSLLHNSLQVLHVMHKLGVRVAGLSHGEGCGENALQGAKSPFGYCTAADRERERKETPGLTAFGRAVVPELNRLGIVVDLAHANDAAFYEAIELSKRPVEFSHGAVFAMAPHWRNLTDDQLKALAGNGGVIGIAPYPNFIDQDPKKQTLQRFVDHIEYVCELVGDDHIGFGADYDGMGPDTVAIIPSHADIPQLTQAMLDRGFSEKTILKFWGGNFLRVMKEVQVG
jgi:membrane dipeptidase